MTKKESKPNLISDLKQVLTDIESLVNDTKTVSEDVIDEVKDKVQETVQETVVHAKDRVNVQEITEKSKLLASKASDYIYSNPWKSIGVAASIGFLIGVLVGHKSSDQKIED